MDCEEPVWDTRAKDSKVMFGTRINKKILWCLRTRKKGLWPQSGGYCAQSPDTGWGWVSESRKEKL